MFYLECLKKDEIMAIGISLWRKIEVLFWTDTLKLAQKLFRDVNTRRTTEVDGRHPISIP